MPFKQKTIHIWLYVAFFILIEASALYYLQIYDYSWFKIPDDGKLYYNIAENFVAGEGLQETIRQEDIIVPPLFSLLLSPFALLFDSPQAFVVFQYVLFGINGLLLIYLTNYLFHSSVAGYVAVLLYAFNPVILNAGPRNLLTETYFITFILLTALILIRWIRAGEKGSIFAALVIILSLSLLFRPHLLYMFGVIGILWLVYVLQKRMSWKSGLWFLLPVVLLILNGTYNYTLHGEFVSLENYSGQNLYIANNPNTKIAFYTSSQLEEFVEPEYSEYREMSLSKRSNLLKGQAIEYIVHHPLATAERMVKKSLLFFKPTTDRDRWMLWVSFVGILLALLTDRTNRLPVIVLLLMIAGYTLLTSVGLLVPGQRYRAPIAPVYLLFAGYIVHYFYSKFIRWRRPRET